MTGSPPLAATVDSLRTARSLFVAAVNTALAGPRLIARDPAAVGAWVALWFLGFAVSQLLLYFGGGVRQTAGHATLGSSFGPYAVLSISVFLLIWAATMVAAFRLALQPDRRGFFYLDLGADELRFAVLTVVACLTVAVLAGAPAFLLFAVASPVLQAAPMLAKEIGVGGAIATMAVEVWVGVRLSLIPVELFAEGRFHLTAYWPLTRGRFWYLLVVYAVCALLVAVVSAAVGASIALLWGARSLILPLQHPIRELSFVGLAAAVALVTSIFCVVPTVILCAAQAHAFRAITSSSPTRRARI
ncbi:MAG TPA: hypothetical protein VG248_05550 [Caulobacteraceae bacterium]|jgi:hypothetical protein|nr:hypothetical protein [Caulobacteraceae bacterium]